MAGDNRRLALNVHKSSRSTVPTVHIFLQRMIRQDNGMLAVTPVCSMVRNAVRNLSVHPMKVEPASARCGSMVCARSSNCCVRW